MTPAPLTVAKSPSFSRNDGGRFSLRVADRNSQIVQSSRQIGGASLSANAVVVRSKANKNQSNLQGQQQQQQQQHQSLGNGGSTSRRNRSNSMLSSKEAEFQNWKRRKNYDPMKAAAEGKKKEAARRAATTLTMSQSMIASVSGQMANSCSSSQSPRYLLVFAYFFRFK